MPVGVTLKKQTEEDVSAFGGNVSAGRRLGVSAEALKEKAVIYLSDPAGCSSETGWTGINVF